MVIHPVAVEIFQSGQSGDHLTDRHPWEMWLLNKNRRHWVTWTDLVLFHAEYFAKNKSKWKRLKTRGHEHILTGQCLLFYNIRLKVDSVGESVRGRTPYPTIIKLNSPLLPPRPQTHTHTHHRQHHCNIFGPLIHTLTHMLCNPIIPLQIENTFKIRRDCD